MTDRTLIGISAQSQSQAQSTYDQQARVIAMCQDIARNAENTPARRWLANATRRLKARPELRADSEVGWLIEMATEGSNTAPPQWWHPDGWTQDSYKALRFGDEILASKYIGQNSISGKATEHVWY
jgi:hypothetical protein